MNTPSTPPDPTRTEVERWSNEGGSVIGVPTQRVPQSFEILGLLRRAWIRLQRKVLQTMSQGG